MIHLFNNVSMTPDCAVYKADKWIMVGTSLIEQYQQSIQSPSFVPMDDYVHLGLLDGQYNDYQELFPRLVELASDPTGDYELVVTKDNWWPLYVSVLKSVLPNLDVNTLEVIISCQWHRMTYSETGQDRGVQIDATRTDLASWLPKPSRAAIKRLFDEGMAIPGLVIDIDHVSWEFQIAAYLQDPEAYPSIEQRIIRNAKKMYWLISVIDRSNTLTKNIPDLEKLTGRAFDVDRDFTDYIQDYPELYALIKYADQRQMPQDIDSVDEQEIINKAVSHFTDYMPKHYDFVDGMPDLRKLATPINWVNVFMHHDAGIDMFTGLPREGRVLHQPYSARHAYYRTVDPNLLTYIYSIKDEPTKLVKFVP